MSGAYPNVLPLQPPGNTITQQRAMLMSSLSESDKHNVVAFLSLTSRNARPFTGIITYLQRSRIHRTISTVCPPYITHQREFWRNAVLDNKDAPSLITSMVYGRKITVSAAILREILDLGDGDDDPKHLNQYKVRGLFARCRYQGELKEGAIMKSGLCPQYKYLAHVLQQCISSRRAGHDELGENIEHAFAALVLNHPFNFSALIFDGIVDNLTTKREPFLMYPRFIQMVINSQAPNLPKFNHDILTLKSMSDTTLSRMLAFKGKDKNQRPAEKRLFGHLADSDYVCPGKKKWRNDDSDSDDEGILPPRDSDDSDSDDDENDGDELPFPAAAPSIPETEIVSSSTGLVVEEDEGSSLGKKKKKRVVPDEGVAGKSWTDFVVMPKKKKSKLQFVMKSTADPPVMPPVQNVQQTGEPIPPPTASTSVPTAPVSDEIMMLKNLLLKVMSDQQTLMTRVDDQERLIKDQAEQIKSRDVKIEDLEKQLTVHKNLLIGSSSETQRLTNTVEDQDSRIAALEGFNANIEFDKGRILRIKAVGESSTAAAERGNDSDDEETESESEKDKEVIHPEN